MANLNQPKSFDKGLIDAKMLSQLEPFIDYCNSNFDQVTRAFFNQITLSENVKGRVITLSAKHRQTITVPSGGGVQGVLPLYVSGGESLKSLSYSVNNRGELGITFGFGGPIPIPARSITYSSPYATIETTADVGPGDIVRIGNTANQANSGEFLVISLLASPRRVVVYNASGVAETKTAYLGSDQTAKSVTLFLMY
jgi:hypothetical protein